MGQIQGVICKPVGRRAMIQVMQWLLKWIAILILGLLLGFSLLQMAQGAFQVIVYYWLNKAPHQYPLSLDSLFWAIKLLAVYLVSIWLLSQYRANTINQSIIRRSIIAGAVLGALLIGMVALDRLVVYYYSNQIDCELPEPPQKIR